MDLLLVKALVAGWAIAVLAGPMGSFVVWQRMAYFGDTLAHSALLGVGLSLILQSDLSTTVLFSSALIAVFLAQLATKTRMAMDTLLGISSHAALAAGVILINLSDSPQVDWTAYLFGDLLALSWSELQWIALLAVSVLLCLTFFWKPLVSIAVDAELAKVEGVNVTGLQTLLLVLIALTVASAMQLVGVLLITALLIIPAATARQWAQTPLQMALIASAIGVTAVTGGLFISYYIDVSAGPAVVVLAFALFLLSLPFKR